MMIADKWFVLILLRILDFISPKGASTSINIVTYGLPNPRLLSSLPFVGPGFDLGLENIVARYGFNISHTYLSPLAAKTCTDLVDQMDIVARYYYTTYNRQEPLMLVLPGKKTDFLGILIYFPRGAELFCETYRV